MKSIAICIPTCREEAVLRRLLDSINNQGGAFLSLFRVTIVVAINSERDHIDSFLNSYALREDFYLKIVRELKTGYVHVRNKLIDETSEFDAIIYVDDDNEVSSGWLNALLSTWALNQTDIITGPINAILPEHAPHWIKSSHTFDSWRRYKTGTYIAKAYTNNVLIPRDVFQHLPHLFDPDFSRVGSEDVHFFREALSAGYRILWCDEALVFTHITNERLTLKYLAKRSFREGQGDAMSIMKSYFFFYAVMCWIIGGCFRLFSGIGYMVLGAVCINYRFVIKGYRRFFSALGTFMLKRGPGKAV